MKMTLVFVGAVETVEATAWATAAEAILGMTQDEFVRSWEACAEDSGRDAFVDAVNQQLKQRFRLSVSMKIWLPQGRGEGKLRVSANAAEVDDAA